MFFGGGGFGGFGGRRRRGPRSRTPSRRGSRRLLRLSFREAVFGFAARRRDSSGSSTCEPCLGNGAEPGTAPVACRTCGGTGEVQSVATQRLRHADDDGAVRDLRGHRSGDPRQVPDLRWGRARAREPPTVDARDPRRRRPTGWSSASAGAGHAGVAGGPAGRPVRPARGRAGLGVRAPRAGSVRGPGHLDHAGGARRRRSTIDGLDGTETRRASSRAPNPARSSGSRARACPTSTGGGAATST